MPALDWASCGLCLFLISELIEMGINLKWNFLSLITLQVFGCVIALFTSLEFLVAIYMQREGAIKFLEMILRLMSVMI